MILAELNILDIAVPVVVVLQVIVALLLILLVMMQKPKQEGLGAAFGGGTAGEVFGARTTDVLQKGTIYLGVLFFALTLLLAILTTAKNKRDGKLEIPADPKQEEPAEPVTPAPVVPEPASDEDAAEPDAAENADGEEPAPTEDEAAEASEDEPQPAPAAEDDDSDAAEPAEQPEESGAGQ